MQFMEKSNKIKTIILILIAFIVIILGISLGSVYVAPSDIISIIIHKISNTQITKNISDADIAIVWNLRLPRVLLAFIAGGALSISGAIMQSVLRNPLASSYTLGVSAGASLGAGIVIVYGISFPIISAFTLPISGFVLGLLTIIIVIAFANSIDGQMQNNTIILFGMVFSLFVNAIITLISSVNKESLQRLVYWQMGSFSMKDWTPIYILLPIVIVGIISVMYYHNELNMMTFGENEAQTMGVNIKKTKIHLLIISAALTGSIISFSGVIGFVDLVAPHIIRKIFGAKHNYVIPMSFIFGGAFMVICDLVARTITSSHELPVGSVTALIGAPFFAYIYFAKREG